VPSRYAEYSEHVFYLSPLGLWPDIRWAGTSDGDRANWPPEITDSDRHHADSDHYQRLLSAAAVDPQVVRAAGSGLGGRGVRFAG